MRQLWRQETVQEVVRQIQLHSSAGDRVLSWWEGYPPLSDRPGFIGVGFCGIEYFEATCKTLFEKGPRRVSRQELYDAFGNDWEMESLQPTRFAVNPKFTEATFSEGGPKAWFAIVQRRA